MKDALLRAMGAAMDGLDVGFCAFDGKERARCWNAAFLGIFPEQLDHIRVGDTARVILQRFYACRLGPASGACVDRFVNEGLERYRTQRAPYEFDHHQYRLRVSSFGAPGLGRVRLWKKVGLLSRMVPGEGIHSALNASLDTTNVLERLADGVAVVDSTDRIVWANQAFRDLYGFASLMQTIGLRMEEVLQRVWDGSPDGGALTGAMRLLADQRRFVGAPFELELPRGQFVRVVEQRGQIDGRSYFIHADITRLKHQQETLTKTEERYRLLAEYSQDIILYVVGAVVTYASPALKEFLGWDVEDVVGRPVADFCHPEDAPRVAEQLHALGERQEADYRARARHCDGTYVWIEARARKLPDDRSGLARFVINARAINARKAIEDELERAKHRLLELAMTDGLTGLANRRKLDEALELEFRRSQREAFPLAVMVLDIDHFKLLNDAHGHQVGDAVLRRMATILTAFPNRAGDLAARLGGEEFVLLLPGANYQQALALAERVRATVQQTAFDPPVNVSVTVSIGVASVDAHTTDSGEELVGLADRALYAAKRAGRNRVFSA
jgi:diguanylate cyclase (GGDEF)-like protein/PAS domain S-box-containing protein